jgi:glycosyltransferase involved in cell wall biosynthesis
MQTMLARGAELRFVSGELRDRLAAATGLDFEGKSHVEPAAIDVSQAPSRTAARLELGLAERASVALVIARLIPEKRVEVALSAASLLDASVVVVGDGPERGALERRFPEARFVGKLPRRRALAWIAASDVLVSASRREGAPTAIREARALAVPVVTTTAGDLRFWAELDPELYVVD